MCLAPMRPAQAILLALLIAGPLACALAGCAANPTENADWPIAVTPAAGEPGRVVAAPPDCGPAPATVARTTVTSWHNPALGLGCSQAHNLAVQAAAPRDLLAGRATGAPDAARETAAVNRYRQGKEKDIVRSGTRSSFGTGAAGGQ